MLLLPGRVAARVRRQAAELLCRYLGGDISPVDEVCALRGLQEELAVRAPEDPARAFGEAVEAAPPAEYLSRVCTDIVGRTVPLMLDKLSSYIDERLRGHRYQVGVDRSHLLLISKPQAEDSATRQ